MATATATLRSHVSPRPLSLVKLRFWPFFLGAQKLRGGRKSAPLFWVLAFGRVLGASMVDVVRLSSLRFSSSPSSSSLTPSSSRQRGALCPPPHKLHRWSDASANCSHGGGVAGLGFGTRKRFASLKDTMV
ncbi:hypothetical protein EUGRSUZ_D02664 [Eucalyptus grandis]|uniref:Uncharacterized protein n=1 Tax=Eucalyptus grandis TaxID=71139 RepID=A0ACC3L8V3_EUCGR|nr:hypothetical protein EUGRSUZ_D02664 [Eucalyptus grandis]